MVATDIRLQGAPNFRDLGGYKTADGHVVKRGLLFRSGNLARLTAADFDVLRQIALRTVIDLRSAVETQMHPSHLPEELGINLINAVVNPYAGGDSSKYKQLLLDDPTPRGAFKTIEATYSLLPDACGPALKVAVDCILAGETPLVFHCSNGRDRTGLISILLLYMLGVPREDIITDYLESNVRINLDAAITLSKTVFTKEYGIEFDYETLLTMNQALEPNVDIAFATINSTHGSPQHYFEAFGIDTNQQQALRQKLLEPA